MSILTATNVGQSFGAFDLFSGVTVAVPRDAKIGLVGPNGIGKTTLLLLLSGRSQPDAGRVHLARGTRVGYLSQESSDAFAGRRHTVFEEMLTLFAAVGEIETQLRLLADAMAQGDDSEEAIERYGRLQDGLEQAGGYDYELRIRQTLSGLGMPENTWQLPLDHLSGGQKTRVLLARLLLEKPDLLILDEPTNHLDIEAIQWLEGALIRWPGAVLVVSHDRYFLDKVVDNIWEMRSRGVELYRGNYSAYLLQREERWQRQQEEFDTFKERVASEMDFIRRHIAGQRTQMAQGKLSRLSREVEVVHAGGLPALGLLKSKGWLQLSHQLSIDRPAATVSELQQRIGELSPPTRPLHLNLRLVPPRRSGRIVLRTHDLLVGYPDRTLFAAEDIELHRLERAALIGANGSGKTTFLRTIRGQIAPLAGALELGAGLEIGYFAQTRASLNSENTVLDEMLRHHPMPISEARSYLARFLFRGDDAYKQVSALSGGERSRLALALLVREKANFLLLDEPTNHLDIPAQEALQAALENFDGTILLVTHDRYLVDRLVTQIWDLQAGRLRAFRGNYQEYLAAQGQDEWLSPPAVDEAASVARPAREPNGGGLSKNELRRRAQAQTRLEEQIHQLEENLASLSKALQAAGEQQAYDQLQRIGAEYSAAEERLAGLMRRWEQVAHE